MPSKYFKQVGRYWVLPQKVPCLQPTNCRNSQTSRHFVHLHQ